MYAVIKTGGKQYKVGEGDVIRVESIPGEIGDTVSLDDVLAVGEGEAIKVGTPRVEGASVVATVLRQDKARKIIIFKKKRRKGYSRKAGHRQQFSELRIEEVKSEKKKRAKAAKNRQMKQLKRLRVQR